MLDKIKRQIRLFFISRKVAEDMADALHKIANAPTPFNEYEYQVFVNLSKNIADNALYDFEKHCQSR